MVLVVFPTSTTTGKGTLLVGRLLLPRAVAVLPPRNFLLLLLRENRIYIIEAERTTTTEEEEEEVEDAEEDVFYAGGTQAWAPDDGTDDDGDAEADEDEEGDAFDWTGGTQAMPPPASPSLEVAAAGTGAVPASVARAEDAPKTASSPKPGQPGFLRVAAKPAAVRRLSARAHDPPATTRDAAEERPAASPLATAPPPVAASDPYSVDVVLSSCAPATGNTQPPACTPAQDVMCSLIPSTFPPPGLQTRGGAVLRYPCACAASRSGAPHSGHVGSGTSAGRATRVCCRTSWRR